MHGRNDVRPNDDVASKAHRKRVARHDSLRSSSRCTAPVATRRSGSTVGGRARYLQGRLGRGPESERLKPAYNSDEDVASILGLPPEAFDPRPLPVDYHLLSPRRGGGWRTVAVIAIVAGVVGSAALTRLAAVKPPRVPPGLSNGEMNIALSNVPDLSANAPVTALVSEVAPLPPIRSTAATSKSRERSEPLPPLSEASTAHKAHKRQVSSNLATKRLALAEVERLGLRMASASTDEPESVAETSEPESSFHRIGAVRRKGSVLSEGDLAPRPQDLLPQTLRVERLEATDALRLLRQR